MMSADLREKVFHDAWITGLKSGVAFGVFGCSGTFLHSTAFLKDFSVLFSGLSWRKLGEGQPMRGSPKTVTKS